jgi:dihydrofolate reductase
MLVSAIVAVAQNGVIGKNNQIPWYLPADLKYFKKVTTGRHIIMGRKCFDSIGRPLPNRTNIVITRDPYFIATGCLVAHSIEEALNIAFENEETEVFIIGGGEIYRQSLEYWDNVYLTEVDISPEGDIFFEPLSDAWVLTSEEAHKADEKNELDYVYKIFKKKM